MDKEELKKYIDRKMNVFIHADSIQNDGSFHMDWSVIYDGEEYIVRYKLWLTERKETIDTLAGIIMEKIQNGTHKA